MTSEGFPCSPLSFLRLQSWLSPTFPNGAYSYSHGLEWAAEAGHVHDRSSLVDWLEADLCYGSGRNEAVFFNEAYRCAIDNDAVKLTEIAELAAASRATSEFALESSQQATACLTTLRRVWPDPILDFFLQKHGITHQHRSFTIQGSFKRNPAAETKRNWDWLPFDRDLQVVAWQRRGIDTLVFDVATFFPA